MKLARNAFLMLALVAAVAACEDDDEDPTDPGNGDEIVVADLAGSYQTQSFIYVLDGSGTPVDVGAAGLGVTELIVASDGSFTGTLVFPHPETGEFTDFPIGGDISLANTSETSADVTIEFDAQTQALGILDASESGTIELEGNALTLILTEVTVPEGTGPAAGADANLVMVATRS